MACDKYGYYHRFTSYLQKNDSTWIIVDRLPKSSHSLVVKTTDSREDYVKLYINRIVMVHGFLCLSSQIEVLSLNLIS